nr:H11 [uncultured bacterium]
MKKNIGALILTASLASVGTASADTIVFYAEDSDANTLLSSSLSLDIDYNSSLWSSIESATLSLFLNDDEGRGGDGNDRADITTVEDNLVTFGDFQITQGTTPSWQSSTYDVPVTFLTDGTLNFVLAAADGDFYYRNASLTVVYSAVPEPATTALLGSGLLVAGLALRRRAS